MKKGSVICGESAWIAGIDGRLITSGPDTHFSCSGIVLERCCMPAHMKNEDDYYDYWDSFLEEVEE